MANAACRQYGRFLIATTACLLLSSCSAAPSSLIAATSPVPPGVRGTIPTAGSDCQYSLLGVIPLSGSPNSQIALNKAKESADVDVLTDVTIDEDAGFFLLFSNHCVRIEGKGVPRALLSNAGGNTKGLL